MTPREHIELCIRRCARSKDGRGPWQASRSLSAMLIRNGSTPVVAQATANACERLGEFIRYWRPT